MPQMRRDLLAVCETKQAQALSLARAGSLMASEGRHGIRSHRKTNRKKRDEFTGEARLAMRQENSDG